MIRKFEKVNIFLFFSPSRMVLAAAGGVDHDKLVELAKKFYCTNVTQKTVSRHALSFPCRYTGSDVSALFKTNITLFNNEVC